MEAIHGEEVDFRSTIKRDKFEQLGAAIFARAAAPLRELLAEAGLQPAQLAAVEIIGGGTRIPVVQKQIMEVFNVAQVMRTLNASECVATGCALMAAMKSPLFKVAEYKVEEYNLYPVKCSWNFKS